MPVLRTRDQGDSPTISTYLPPLVGAEPPAADYLWQLDEASGNRAAVRGTLLTEVGGTIGNAAGMFGNAAVFTGTSGEHLRTIGFSLTTQRTISVWFYCPTMLLNPNLGQLIVGSSDGLNTSSLIWFESWSTRRIQFYNGSANMTSDAGCIVDGWNHIVSVVEGSGSPYTRKLWLNGVKKQQTLGAFDTTGPDLTVGGTITPANSRPLEGRVDQLAIWDPALTDDNVDWLFNLGVGRPLV